MVLESLTGNFLHFGFLARLLGLVSPLIPWDLLSTPAERIAESFPLLCPEGTPEDLAALMALKGMKKQMIHDGTFVRG